MAFDGNTRDRITEYSGLAVFSTLLRSGWVLAPAPPLLWAQLDSKERTKRKRGHFRTQKGAPRTLRLVEIAIRLDGQGERAFD